jgi:hypothetical protein
MRRATGAEGVSVNGRCISQGSTRRSSLLANPSSLDGSRQLAQVGVRRQVGEPCVTTSAEA